MRASLSRLLWGSFAAGERVILVDPTPIAWTKPLRQGAGNWNKSKTNEREEQGRTFREGEEAEEEEDGGDSGPHRRKRGVLGCRRRVKFPGRAATCSTRCRELWRRHLQVHAVVLVAVMVAMLSCPGASKWSQWPRAALLRFERFILIWAVQSMVRKRVLSP